MNPLELAVDRDLHAPAQRVDVVAQPVDLGAQLLLDVVLDHRGVVPQDDAQTDDDDGEDRENGGRAQRADATAEHQQQCRDRSNGDADPEQLADVSANTRSRRGRSLRTLRGR
ncbi:hypothetical protein FL583_34100 [Cryptosporangium phraense]|uniref:Uncharacterized protein n=1 Tax=Cryptosporangium phraense TaxID=2593070 RepID=A0A545AGX8_9ACTN|nr:hypothetical protein FL583_34100 [Cryptosporangium phraense]